MKHKQNLVNLLSNFPNVSTPSERQAFINTVGLTKLVKDIDIAGNTRTFFNTLIDVVVKTDGPNGLFNFIDDLIASDWVGVDRILTLENLKTQLQNLDSRQWRDEFGYVTIPDPVIIENCPYQGLFAFGETDAQYFFGRETVADQLVTAAESRSLLAVIGASGSGKSSVVFAGLVPRLRKQGKWAIASFRPGDRPFYYLASALVGLLETQTSEVDKLVATNKLTTALLAEEVNLADVIDKIAENQQSKRVLLIADQFEELYALCREKKLRQSFLGSLLAATNFTLLLTLRADFCGYALSDRSFTDALQNADFKLGPMNRQELEEAIVKPAQMLDVELEAGLSDRILEAVGEEPGNLPLLQFALAQLWEKQSRGRLTHVAYDDIGGVEQALVKYADEEYNKFGEEERERVRRAFVQLVSPGEGTQDTRRLATAAEVGAQNWDLIKRLADSRLVVTGSSETGEETVEVIHEALIREWGILREWMEGSREFRTWQKRLRERMREWENKNQDEGELLRGASLVEAREWYGKRLEELSLEEREFVRLSGELREREERERRRRRQEKTWGLAAFLILAGVAGLQWQQAIIGKQIAKNSQMITLINAIELNFDLTQDLNVLIDGIKQAKELKEANWTTTETKIQAIDMLQKMLYWQGFKEYNSLNKHSQEVNGVAFNSNGELIASASSDKTATIWKEDGSVVTNLEGHSEPIYRVKFGYHHAYGDEELIATASKDTTAKIWRLDGTLIDTFKHNSPVHRVAFSPKGNLIVTAAEDGTVKFYRSDRTVITAKEHSALIYDVAFSPNGELIATAGFDGIVNLWKSDGSLFKALEEHRGYKVYSIAFSRNSDLIATASEDETVKLWKSEDGSLIKTLTEHEEKVLSVAFSPDGNLIASADSGKSAIIWKSDGNLVRILEGHSGTIFRIAFSHDGKFIITSSADQTIKLWTTEGDLIDTLEGHSNWVYNAVFSPKNNLIASASMDASVKLWKYTAIADTFDGYHCRRIAFNPKGDLIALGCYDWKFYLLNSTNPTSSKFQQRSSDVNSVAFNPKNDLIATGSKDGTVELWKSKDGSPVRSWEGHNAAIYDLAFSPNGELIATASEDKTVKLWKPNGDLENTLKGHNRSVISVGFSPKEDLIASGSLDGTIRLWRRDGTLIKTLQDHKSSIFSVTFSPSGDAIASASADKTIKLWKPDGTLLKTLEGHGGIVTGVAFSPQGNLIASTSHDKTLKLWKRDGTLIHTFVGHEHLVESLAFSPSGDIIATISDDNTLKLWNLNLDDLLVRGCDWVRDYLNTLPDDHPDKNLCDDIN